MKGNFHLYYDEAGDYLELQVGEPREGYYEELEDGVFERKGQNTPEVLGVAIFNVSKIYHQSIDWWTKSTCEILGGIFLSTLKMGRAASEASMPPVYDRWSALILT